MHPDTAIEHVNGSNLTGRAKSELRKWYEHVTHYGEAELAPRGSIKSHMTHQIGAARQLVGAGATGVVLGWAQAAMPHGLDLIGNRKLPLDGLGGAIATFGGAALAAHGSTFGNDIRNAGAVAFGIFTMRKGHDFFAERRLHAGAGGAPRRGLLSRFRGAASPAHGEDPILAAARGLD